MWRSDLFPTSPNKTACNFACALVAVIVGLSVANKQLGFAIADEPSKTQNTEEKKWMNTITGEFEVKITPADTGDPQIGMMLLDKRYIGDLKATGNGRMLTGMTSVKNSAAYVAIERIEGELKGKRGSFLIQHSGTMTKEKQSLIIRVVPDSGTGDLAGIDGTMDIRIVERKHFYDFRYTLADPK